MLSTSVYVDCYLIRKLYQEKIPLITTPNSTHPYKRKKKAALKMNGDWLWRIHQAVPPATRRRN